MERVNLHPDLRYSEFNLDEIAFVPSRIPSENQVFEWHAVDLTTRLTKNIILKAPIISSPMDTVTEAEMAILMALHGGIGVIHYNFPTIEDQMEEIEKVRKFEAGFIRKPVVLSQKATIGDVFLEAEKNGFFTYPITIDGTLNSKLVGIVTRRDVRYKEDLSQSVKDVMTRKSKLVTAKREDTLDKNDIRAANSVIRAHNLETLPIVDADFKIVALVTDRDLQNNDKYKLATKDDNKQLKVLVAVESRLELARERIMAAENFGASGIVVDSRNIYWDHIEIAKFTKQAAPSLEVILGNVVDGRAARFAIENSNGAIAALRNGIGGGEVCTTTEELGPGRKPGQAIVEVTEVIDELNKKYGFIGHIFDGGNKYARHLVGGLLLGADVGMLGSILAGLDESPGRKEWSDERERMEKKVRGMGSAAAINERAGSNRYSLVVNKNQKRHPEGIVKNVAYRGSGDEFLELTRSGIQQSMHCLGAKNIKDLRLYGYIVPWNKASSKGTI